jgi:hypothetical protein
MNGTHPPLSPPVPAEPQDQERRPDSEEPRRRRSRRTTAALVVAFIVLVLLAIFLPPLINLGQYKRSITASMSLAIGRPVYVGGMQLRLLPVPGIVMSDLTVQEDPAFGFEPALRANSVVAYLRFSSLWRGRLEVSRISLDEASLNLVKNDRGEWNIGSVLQRASQISNAPTGERHAGRNPRFPYIEASDSRINFKEGVEKKPFSLMNAEFSMWQASDNQWRLRLKGQPVRTDLELHLSDTGVVSVEGSLERRPSLDAMPVNLTAKWSGAQLGQVSRILAGVDSGWRGSLNATATLTGTAADLNIRSNLKVANLRRLEFQPANTVDVNATCQAQYHHLEHELTGVTCFWPVAQGHLLLTAKSFSLARRSGDLAFEINQIPAQFPITVLALMRPRLAGITSAGTINGRFQVTAGDTYVLTGRADATGVSLSSGSHTLPLPTLHFITQAPPPRGPGHSHGIPLRLPNTISLEPISIPLGAPQPLIADARIAKSGFALHLAGQASIERLIAVSADFGLLGRPLTGVAGRGRAELNTTTASDWLAALSNPVPPPTTSGSVRLQNAEVSAPFLHGKVSIDSADIFLSPQQITWQNAIFHYRGLALSGSLQLPVLCSQPTPCPANFSLQSQSLDAGALESALTAPRQSGIFGQFLSDALGASTPAVWPLLHGSVEARTLQMGRLPLHNVTATVNIDGRSIAIPSLAANTLGGAFHGSGNMNMDSGVPSWTIAAQITGVQAGEAGTLFRQRWGSGTISGDLKLTASGYHLPELLSSAAGDYRAVWQKGEIPSSPALPLSRFDRWSASGTIANRTVTVAAGTVARHGRTESVRGSIGFDRRLNLLVQTRNGPVRIGGTLPQPVAAQR